ncbi:DivIVA domain-containing protein [Streptodolium elevatio]|uniref:DivIVA domain-containing protein n=1 Tax=Streptodolium elevatio TaxID=3157996 RepID=A0ABV3DRJ0_9ACTN
MFWIQLVVVTGVVFVVAAVVLGAGGSLADAHQDRPDLSWTPDRPLTVEDIDRVRFPVVLRGYRMSEVDYTLDRLSAELSARDARIMDLEYRLAGVLPPGVAAPAQGSSAMPGAAPTTVGPAGARTGTPTLTKQASPDDAERAREAAGDADGERGDAAQADAVSAHGDAGERGGHDEEVGGADRREGGKDKA